MDTGYLSNKAGQSDAFLLVSRLRVTYRNLVQCWCVEGKGWDSYRLLGSQNLISRHKFLLDLLEIISKRFLHFSLYYD